MKNTMKKLVIALGILGMTTVGFSAAKKPAPKTSTTNTKQCKDKNGKIIKCPVTSSSTKKKTTTTSTSAKKTSTTAKKQPAKQEPAKK